SQVFIASMAITFPMRVGGDRRTRRGATFIDLTARRAISAFAGVDVTGYGLGSADSANGKRYWVLEVGN
ncbi:MAG: hypothetical protein WA439_06440, partial [Pseudolabrys sp.]